MNSNYKFIAAVIGSFVLGAGSVQMLHAQAKPKAYAVVAYHSVSDPEKLAAYALKFFDPGRRSLRRSCACSRQGRSCR